MKKNFDNIKKEMRPAAVMLLCTCIAFSAVSSYVPPVSQTDVSVEETSETETEYETVPVSEPEETEETSEAETEAEKIRDLSAPSPYKLNFANMYEEGADESYAEILMKELIVKDSQWYAQIYDMANTAPVKLASRMGRSKAQVTGQYNPASKTHNPDDPASWTVEHFKNVRVSFLDGDGNITSAVSNAQQILSMASVYCYYNGIEDLDGIRNYVSKLWSASHAYSAAMGNVYYCGGCVDPDYQPGKEEEDSELEGEDYFNGESTINTEITIKETGTAVDENGEPLTGEESGTESLGEPSGFDGESGSLFVGSDGTISLPETQTTPEFSGTTVAVETTKSALEAVMETAEKVYYESSPKAVIVRPGDSSDGESQSGSVNKGSGAVIVNPEESSPKESEGEGAGSPTSGKAEDGPTPATKAPEVSVIEPSTKAPETPAPAKEEAEEPAETSQETTAYEKTPGVVIVPVADAGESFDYTVHAASVPEGAEEKKALICPGHIDLKITARVYSLDEAANLYAVDQIGNTASEESGWTGWNDRARAFVSHIERQDWTETYDLSVIVEGTKAPLSSTEIESYMNQLPKDTSEIRKSIIRFALQSVGKVPYYWGGKASAKNYSGNNFGSITIPDHRGRILKGLDCSGWINWVYWSVTGTRPAYEGTEGLKSMGRQVKRSDLKPGDIIVITGSTPHVIMFLGWAPNGQIRCIHETGSVSNVTVGVMSANWPYYRNLLD